MSLEKEMKGVIKGYKKSILDHRELEHKSLEKIRAQKAEIRKLKEDLKETQDYVERLEKWLGNLKNENAKLKENKLI